MNAYASFGYLDNQGTQRGQWYKRYTGKVTASITPVKWMQLGRTPDIITKFDCLR